MAPSNARKNSGTPHQGLQVVGRDDAQFGKLRLDSAAGSHEVFIDPMLGHSLSFFVHDDITSRTLVVEAIKNHGGTVLQGYSQATYIIVNPSTTGGQSLWRLYHGKKVKVLLEAEWVFACIRAGGVQNMAHANSWGGFQITCVPDVNKGSTPQSSVPAVIAPVDQNAQHTCSMGYAKQNVGSKRVTAAHAVELPLKSQSSNSSQPAQLTSTQDNSHPFPGLSRWSSLTFSSSSNLAASSILGQIPASMQWDHSTPSDFAPSSTTEEGATVSSFSLPPNWTEEPNRSFSPMVYYQDYNYGVTSTPEHSPPGTYDHACSSRASLSTLLNSSPSTPPGAPQVTQATGRKRKRASENVVDASVFVQAPNPSRRSPTPPRTTVSSLHGGNVFTSEDIDFLHKYIEYCRDKGLVLSLREICEKLAIKAPHHSFFSWRRFCNKHKIRLGSYLMETAGQGSPSIKNAVDAGGSNGQLSAEARGVSDTQTARRMSRRLQQETTLSETSEEESSASEDDEGAETVPPQWGLPVVGQDAPEQTPPFSSEGYTALTNNLSIKYSGELQNGDRETFFQLEEPKPPTSLYRSSTGKGIAFTSEDVEYLLKFMSYRKHQDGVTLNMVQFWKDVAESAPHHSRASWMKYWRRHKHELEGDRDEIVAPAPPSKRARYTRKDDILLAQFFATQRVDDSQDNLFRLFASKHPHHPWKGWQERYRVHRAEISHMIDLIQHGKDLESSEHEAV